MGFKIGRTFALEFAGTALAEGDEPAEVKVRSASVGTLSTVLEGNSDLKEDAEVFAKHLVSWNLEDEAGNALPLTAEGLMSLEEPMLRLLLTEWIKATRGITAPLDHRSSSGEQQKGEESISMESL